MCSVDRHMFCLCVDLWRGMIGSVVFPTSLSARFCPTTTTSTWQGSGTMRSAVRVAMALFVRNHKVRLPHFICISHQLYWGPPENSSYCLFQSLCLLLSCQTPLAFRPSVVFWCWEVFSLLKWNPECWNVFPSVHIIWSYNTYNIILLQNENKFVQAKIWRKSTPLESCLSWPPVVSQLLQWILSVSLWGFLIGIIWNTSRILRR